MKHTVDIGPKEFFAMDTATQRFWASAHAEYWSDEDPAADGAVSLDNLPGR